MSENTLNNGIGFLGLLEILFIGLKLAGFITWSWVWVLAPIWIPIILLAFIATLGFIVILFTN